MTSYQGRHAELYDLFYADKPYREEAAFVHQCLLRFAATPAHRILELACGTGLHAAELGKLGYEVVGVDHSPDMLAQARRNADRAKFVCQDMRALAFSKRDFDAAVCLFDSIGYVASPEAVVEVFHRVHAHLRPASLFIFEFWHAPAMLTHFEPVRVRRWTMPAGEVLRIAETSLDRQQQLARVAYSIYELHHDGTFTGFQEMQLNRFFQVEEMVELVKRGGFTPVAWFSNFSFAQPITEHTFHVVAVTRRTS